MILNISLCLLVHSKPKIIIPGLCESDRNLPRGRTPGQEGLPPGHLRLVKSYSKENPAADERLGLWNVHMQVRGVPLQEGEVHLLPVQHAIFP